MQQPKGPVKTQDPPHHSSPYSWLSPLQPHPRSLSGLTSFSLHLHTSGTPLPYGPHPCYSHHPENSSLKHFHGSFHDTCKYQPVPASSGADSDQPVQTTPRVRLPAPTAAPPAVSPQHHHLTPFMAACQGPLLKHIRSLPFPLLLITTR